MSQLRWDRARRDRPTERFDRREFQRPNDTEQSFNRIYRQRRVAASASNIPFPTYSRARERLAEVAREARANDGIDPAQFWNQVFSTGGGSFD
jgi:hypothetical protein